MLSLVTDIDGFYHANTKFGSFDLDSWRLDSSTSFGYWIF